VSSSFVSTVHRRDDGRRDGARANGYRLTASCACGVVFERWVPPEEADATLLPLVSLN